MVKILILFVSSIPKTDFELSASEIRLLQGLFLGFLTPIKLVSFVHKVINN